MRLCRYARFADTPIVEQEMPIETLKEINRRKTVSSLAPRDQVAVAMIPGHSQSQAYELIELPRSMTAVR